MKTLLALLVIAASSANSEKLNCSELAGGFYARGHDVGAILSQVCEFWPLDKAFPVKNVHEAEELLNATFKEGGMYDKAKAVIAQRQTSTDFCWRKSSERSLVKPTGYSCPQRLNANQRENPNQVEPTASVEDGNLYCNKSCADICGSWLVKGNPQPGLCGCRSRDPTDMGTAGYMYVYKEWPHIKPALPDGCDQTFEANHTEACYGTCPSDAVPTWVLGNIKPVCSSDCRKMNLTYGCGFGCASSMIQCVSTVSDQIGEIVRTVGDTAGFVSGQDQISVVTNALVSTAEFAVTGLTTLVGDAVTAWTHFEQEKQSVGLITALLAAVKEVKADIPDYQVAANKFVKMSRDLISVLHGWHGFKWQSSLNQVIQLFLKNGAGILLGAYQLFEAFAWPKCLAPPPPSILVV